MEEGGYWTNMITRDGLEELNFSMTQDTEQNYEMASEVQVDVPVMSNEGAPQSRGSRPFSKRTKNFDPKEDTVVCSAWLNVSKDPVHGASQSRSSFWGRVRAYFEKHKTTPACRTESSIMHRWLTIQAQVNKYCACYEAIERRNQSGATIQDKISQASEMFKGLDDENKTFTLIHCWNKLKEEDKWKAKRKELAEQQKQAGNKKQKINKDYTPRNVEANNTEDVIEIEAPDCEEKKRPQGQKKAKEALRRRDGEACMEALDKMWARKEAIDMEKEKKKDERFVASLELDKKRVAIEDKKAESDLMKEEKEIMTMDMTSLSPLQKQYYEIMQHKIIARRLEN